MFSFHLLERVYHYSVGKSAGLGTESMHAVFTME